MAKEAQVSFVIVAKDAATKAISGVNRALGGLKSGAATVGKAFLAIGTAAVAGITALAGGIAYATKQAAEEEKGIKKLTATIQANVKGRTDMAKVEAEIAKRQQTLAYSDGELRDSLAALLPFTGSTEKAFQAQGVAADFARAKNIDLETASKQIGLALNGNTRVLKQLGIELPKTASQAEILAAIQQKVAGQADAYAQSTEGQFVILQNSLSDLTEEIGAAFLPIALELVKWANESLIPAVKAALPGIIAFGKGFIEAAVAIGKQVIPVVQEIAKFIFTNVVPAFQKFAQALFGKGGVAESVMGVVGPIAKDLLPIFGTIFKAVGELIGQVFKLVGVLWGNGKGPLAIAVQAIGLAFKVVGTVLGTIISIIGKVVGAIAELIRIIMNSPIGGVLGFVGDIIGGILGKEKGGPVKRGTPYIVGEGGPELFVPRMSGTIIPNSQAQLRFAGATAGAAPVVHNYVTLDGRNIATSVNTRLGRTASATNRRRG